MGDQDELLHSIDKHTGVMAEQLKQIAEHLRTLNGRVERSEQRIQSLEAWRSEQRGALRSIVFLASIPPAILGAIATWFAQHGAQK